MMQDNTSARDRLPPFAPFIQDIEGALSARLYFAAIMGALTIPHLCGALEDSDNRSPGTVWRRWWAENAEPSFGGCLPADVAYSLRCGYIHQGQVRVVGHPEIKRIAFAMRGFLEDPDAVYFHRNIFNDTLCLDAEFFCSDVMQAADQWWERSKDLPNVLSNGPKVLTRQPSADFLHVGGLEMPFIA